LREGLLTDENLVAIELGGIVVVVGNYGSGKTEVSINLAVEQKKAGVDVRVADLDLVNPYFRTREARTLLSDLGIDLVLPPESMLHADLPLLSPMVAGMIRKPSELTIIDVGGNDAGATVLSALAEAFRGRQCHMLQVINPLRPNTDTIAGCLNIRRQIEDAARMPINGLIGNANLIDETAAADIYRGVEFVQRLSQESALALRFVTIAAELLPDIDLQRIPCPVLTIYRQLVPPWKKAQVPQHQSNGGI
jgi:MinD-like ATPase involved in chromosome partitioning or flagellar assembly